MAWISHLPIMRPEGWAKSQGVDSAKTSGQSDTDENASTTWTGWSVGQTKESSDLQRINPGDVFICSCQQVRLASPLESYIGSA